MKIINSIAPIETTVIQESTQEDNNQYIIIIWDDDYHTFDYVIEVFMQHFGLDEKTAMQKTLEVHCEGSSCLDKGSQTNMEFHAMIMDMQYGLTATVEKEKDS